MRFCPAVTNKKKEGTLPSTWVLQIVKEIRHFVGLSRGGFEEELLLLFAVIEASHSKQVSASCSNLGKKDNSELRKLSCSINYDAISGSASHGRVKGRVASVFYEAQVGILECERVE